VVGFTSGSRGDVSGKREPVIREYDDGDDNDNNNNNNNKAVITTYINNKDNIITVQVNVLLLRIILEKKDA
jgi:hypothetical protein